MPHPERTTSSAGAGGPAPSPRFFLILAVIGGVVGLLLLLLGAPFWLFYVAPLAVAPLLVWKLLRLPDPGRVGSDSTAHPRRPSRFGRSLVAYESRSSLPILALWLAAGAAALIGLLWHPIGVVGWAALVLFVLPSLYVAWLTVDLRLKGIALHLSWESMEVRRRPDELEARLRRAEVRYEAESAAARSGPSATRRAFVLVQVLGPDAVDVLHWSRAGDPVQRPFDDLESGVKAAVGYLDRRREGRLVVLDANGRIVTSRSVSDIRDLGHDAYRTVLGDWAVARGAYDKDPDSP